MATLIIKHRVANFDTWRQGFEAHASERKKYGFTACTVLRDTTDPNLLTCVLQAKDMTQAKTFLAQPALRDAMEKAGVQGAPEISFCDQALSETLI
jgi:hypothetical protein